MRHYAIIVDPFSSGAYYAPELSKRGMTPLAVLSEYPILSIFSQSFIATDFSQVFVYQGDIAALVISIRAFANGNDPVLVLPGAERGIELADIISTMLCRHASNGTELSLSRRNKYSMDDRLNSLGISVPAYIKASSAEAVLVWARRHDFVDQGVVVKPLNSAGTDGVIACFSEQQITMAVASNLGKKNKFNIVNQEILAQEFLLGTEYVVDTVSKDGKHIVTNICRYKKTSANGAKFVYEYCDFIPQDTEIQQLANYTFKVLDGLGIRHGPAHSEIMYTDRGPLLIETGARMHGGPVAIPACRLATGNSQLDLTLDLFLGKTLTPPEHIMAYCFYQYTRIIILIAYVEGVVTGYSHRIEKINRLPSFKLMKLGVQIDEPLVNTIDLVTSPGLIVISHTSFAQLEQDYQKIRQFERDGLFKLKALNHG